VHALTTALIGNRLNGDRRHRPREHWVEGLQLMAVYLILALAFYFVP
jgi:hypothetical protein